MVAVDVAEGMHAVNVKAVVAPPTEPFFRPGAEPGGGPRAKEDGSVVEALSAARQIRTTRSCVTQI